MTFTPTRSRHASATGGGPPLLHPYHNRRVRVVTKPQQPASLVQYRRAQVRWCGNDVLFKLGKNMRIARILFFEPDRRIRGPET